jgi:hypothetical protein
MDVSTTGDLTQGSDPTPSSGRVGTVNHWAMQEAESILARVAPDVLTPEARVYLQHAIALTLMRILGHMDAPCGQQNMFLAEMGYLAYVRRLMRDQPPVLLPQTLDALPPCAQEAFVNFTAAVRRRVVIWKLTAEEVTV